MNRMSRLFRKIRSSTYGAAMVEYGFILVMIVIGAIASVAVFGSNVTTYFTGAANVLSDVEGARDAGSGEVRFVYGDPVVPAQPVDVFGHIGSGCDILLGTDYPDVLQMDGVYECVYGLSGADNITGTGSDEIFVPGPGDDIVSGGNGADTYSYTLGDGIDFITENGSDGASDTLNVPFINLADISGRRENEAVVLEMPDGGEIWLMGVLENFEYDGHLEQSIFADVTLADAGAFRDMLVEKQKAGGSVHGTKLAEDYFHTAAVDGTYTIRDDHYLSNLSDMGTFTFTDQSASDVSFSLLSDDSLVMRTADGDTITVLEQDEIQQREGINSVVFQVGGVTLDRVGIRSKAFDDQKPSGSVRASRYTEVMFHDMTVDGSYTVSNNHYLTDPLEVFEIRNALISDVEFFFTGSNSQTDFQMRFNDGDVVTILDGFDRLNLQEGIIGVEFVTQGVTMLAGDIITKVQDDQRGTGYIRGLDGNETFKYLASDVNLTYYAGYELDFDVLDMEDYVLSETTFSRSGNDLVMDLITGQRLILKSQFNGREGFEEFRFDNGMGGISVLSEADMDTLSSS